MSKWRFGCGKPIMVFTHSEHHGYREHKVECGSTAFDGGVNQCDECERKYPVKSPLDDVKLIELDAYEEAILERALATYIALQDVDRAFLHPEDPDARGIEEMTERAAFLKRRIEKTPATEAKR